MSGVKRFLLLVLALALLLMEALLNFGGDLSILGAPGKAEEAIGLSMADEVERYLKNVNEPYARKVAKNLSTDDSLLSSVLGFRTAGSDAEHAGAAYLEKEMKQLGLSQVQQVPVEVDRWEYTGATLTLDGTEIVVQAASYMLDGTEATGLTAEIVDAGTGFASDYESADVEGKIALVGVDPRNQAGIDQYLYEAATHGAAAMVTYSTGGYGMASDDTIFIQDVGCGDLMPAVSISRKQYQTLAQAMKEGHTRATLNVESVMQEGGGTSYNVMGTLKGRSSDQQILVAGHYDTFFNGFQDNCSGMGAVLGMAKAMVDAGYHPEHDIVFLAHAAGEWGATDSAFGQGRGAYEMLQANPDWADRTIALIELEQTAVETGAEQPSLFCVPEYAEMVRQMAADSDLVEVSGKGGVNLETQNSVVGDSLAYQCAGIACIGNDSGIRRKEKKKASWEELNWHTNMDTVKTYSPKVMAGNLNLFGTLAIYLDQMPAQPLDLSATCDELEQALQEKQAREAGVDVDAYQAALTGLRQEVKDWNRRIDSVNASYEQAVHLGASQEELDRLRAQGEELNRTSRKAFRLIQEELMGVQGKDRLVVRHVGYQENVALLTDLIAALEKGELFNEKGNGALDLARKLNAGTESCYFSFTTEAVDESRAHLDAAEENRKFWSEGKGYVLTETAQATVSLLERAEDPSASTTKERKLFREEREDQLKRMAKEMEREQKGISELTRMLQEQKQKQQKVTEEKK